MLKSIQYLILLSLFIPVLANPAFTREEQKAIAGTEQQTLKLYKGFFPYQACLLVNINQVLKKPKKVLVLNVTVDDVYLGNCKKGSPQSFSFYEGEAPQLFDFLLTLKDTKQIIAFNNWPNAVGDFEELTKASKNPIYRLWIPYAGKRFQSGDIAQIKALIKDSPTRPDQAKAAFQRLLETKWTPKRINDFCRAETQNFYGQASEHCAGRKDDWFPSPMNSSLAAELGGKTVEWQAVVEYNVPTFYNILVLSADKNKGWNLEVAKPSIVEWTDENFLIHRISYSIQQATWVHWLAKQKLHPRSSGYYRDLFVNRSRETLAKDKTGKVTSFQCRLSNGKTLTAILTADKLQSVDKILINDKFDQGWTGMYKDNLSNFSRLKN